jgi:hypothetical protein
VPVELVLLLAEDVLLLGPLAQDLLHPLHHALHVCSRAIEFNRR